MNKVFQFFKNLYNKVFGKKEEVVVISQESPQPKTFHDELVDRTKTYLTHMKNCPAQPDPYEEVNRIRRQIIERNSKV